jgi:hypothetical protein
VTGQPRRQPGVVLLAAHGYRRIRARVASGTPELPEPPPARTPMTPAPA